MNESTDGLIKLIKINSRYYRKQIAIVFEQINVSCIKKLVKPKHKTWIASKEN